MQPSLKQTTFNNVRYNAIGRALSFLFQALANIILSRELGANDYGIVGYAMICVNMLKPFTDLGVNSAAIHGDTFTRKEIDTLFCLRQLLGFLIVALLFVGSSFVDRFIQIESLAIIIKLLALNILINNLSVVPYALLARELAYFKIAIAETCLVAASSLVAVIMALNGFKYWSIVAGHLAANITFVILLNIFRPQRVALRMDKATAHQFLRFGTRVFLTGFLTFLIFNYDNFVIGTVAGTTSLGYYTIAYNWGTMVCSLLAAVVTGILFPTLSRIKNEPARLKESFLAILQYLMLASVLFNFGLLCAAKNFLVSVLGGGTGKWLPALLTLQILCCYGILRSLVEPVAALFTARGLVQIPLQAGIVVAVVEVLLVYPAIRYGRIEMVGVAVLFAYACQLAVYLPALRSSLDIHLIDLLRPFCPAIAAGGIMLFANVLINGYAPGGIVKLVVSCLLLASLYLFSYGLMTKWRVYAQIRELITGRG